MAESDYRMLEEGEILLPGDEYFSSFIQRWGPSSRPYFAFEQRVHKHEVGYYRRPICTQVDLIEGF